MEQSAPRRAKSQDSRTQFVSEVVVPFEHLHGMLEHPEIYRKLGRYVFHEVGLLYRSDAQMRGICISERAVDERWSDSRGRSG